MKILSVILTLALAAAGCASKSTARLKEQNAFLAGQNMALQQQAQNAAPTPGVTIVGAVQHPQVPWVAGLTLAQAVATANYTGADAPTQIIITRQGESAAMDAKDLLDGTVIPLEVGDVIELR
jgi:PBP1b-binding outer membrane lipoprotein LpoB